MGCNPLVTMTGQLSVVQNHYIFGAGDHEMRICGRIGRIIGAPSRLGGLWRVRYDNALSGRTPLVEYRRELLYIIDSLVSNQ